MLAFAAVVIGSYLLGSIPFGYIAGRLAALAGVAIWILTFLLTRYVSVASITAAATLPVVILITTRLSQNFGKWLFYSSVCLAAVVIWRHRSNLSRLIRGTEPRFTRK